MNRSTLLRRRLAPGAVVATAVALLAGCGGGGTGEPSAPAQAFTATHVGGPTTILEIGGLRLLLDPTFDAPKKYRSGLEKTRAPALDVEQIGRIDAVLLSHDQHDDNLDDTGRALLKDVPVVLSTPGARRRLGDHVTALRSWESHRIATADGTVEVTAVPALHGPDGVDRGADGEVTGFVLSGDGVPTTYISGDNASVKVAEEVGDRIRKDIGPLDTAVLFAGAARTPAILGNAPLTLTSANAARVAKALDPRKVVAVHTDGWNIYSEDMPSLVEAFRAQGIDDELVDLAPYGTPKSLS
ncbi:MBL fold metallo-hydrolase [Streptomyces sp. NPDC091368]|uniref:MBL fold metallo-hydrolase n=1 Tax=Streptomyces sp. NPDC091368 TaxID=3365993 RepID=UPI003801D4C8